MTLIIIWFNISIIFWIVYYSDKTDYNLPPMIISIPVIIFGWISLIFTHLITLTLKRISYARRNRLISFFIQSSQR
jgi:hypothetical protein